MNRTLALRASASVRAAAGKVPRATILAYNGGRIHPPGFPDGVVIDLANLQSVPRPALLLDHQDDQVVGQADQVTIGARTVELGGPITGNIEDPNDPAGKVIFHARRGFIWPCSVGVAINSIERLLPGQTASANGQTFTGPVEVVRAGLLQEVSFLSVAADADARATIAAKRAARGG
jgi:hypothetical protein